MSKTANKNKRKLTTLQLSPAARAALRRITEKNQWTMKIAVETALLRLDDVLTQAPGGRGI